MIINIYQCKCISFKSKKKKKDIICEVNILSITNYNTYHMRWIFPVYFISGNLAIYSINKNIRRLL